MSNPLQVLYFDIETTPTIFAAWRTGQQYLTYDQILKYGEVMCIAWAWNDEKVKGSNLELALYDWYKKDDEADLKMLSDFQQMSSKADLVVGHNGKNFDISVLRARLVRHQLPDLVPFLVDDTLIMTKDIEFPSHKLDGLGDYLGLGRKESHGNGMEWWIDIMRGGSARLREMMKYNFQDVELLRRVYKRVKPYTKSNLNMAVYSGDRGACPSCGKSGTLVINKHAMTKAGKRTRFQCKSCGNYCTEGTNLIKNSEQFPR